MISEEKRRSSCSQQRRYVNRNNPSTSTRRYQLLSWALGRTFRFNWILSVVKGWMYKKTFKIQFCTTPFYTLIVSLSTAAWQLTYCKKHSSQIDFLLCFFFLGGKKSFRFTGRVVSSGSPAASSRSCLSPSFDSASSGKVLLFIHSDIYMNDDIYCDVFILYLMFSFNLASGIGDVYFAIQFLGDRCQVKMLEWLTYMMLYHRHVSSIDVVWPYHMQPEQKIYFSFDYKTRIVCVADGGGCWPLLALNIRHWIV